MNFVQQLEECLRDLAAEARKKHPGVKEASERAQLKLRSLQNTYIQQVRQANQCNATTANNNDGTSPPSSAASRKHAPHKKAPTTALFASSELLHPFLLAANYPNAMMSSTSYSSGGSSSSSGSSGGGGSSGIVPLPRLLEISFRAMKLLIAHDAVLKQDGIHMVRVWMIQAQVIAGYYEKQYGYQYYYYYNPSPSLPEQQPSATKRHQEQQQSTSQLHQDSSSSAPAPAVTTSSSWFSWGSSSSSSSTTAAAPSKHSASATSSSSSHYHHHPPPAIAVKNAVSSSSGQTGHSSSSLLSISNHNQNPQVLDRIAKEILSCLLQLLQFLLKDDDDEEEEEGDEDEEEEGEDSKSDDNNNEEEETDGSDEEEGGGDDVDENEDVEPQSNSHSHSRRTSSSSNYYYPPLEFWTNATALSVLWLPLLPPKHTVHQAARSTVMQVLSGLFSLPITKATIVSTTTISRDRSGSGGAISNTKKKIKKKKEKQRTPATTPTTATTITTTTSRITTADARSLRTWQAATWDDLLHLVVLRCKDNTTSNNNASKKNWQGALSLCQKQHKLPTREFGLELLVQLWHQMQTQSSSSSQQHHHQQQQDDFFLLQDEKIISRTLGVCMSLLRETGSRSNSHSSSSRNKSSTNSGSVDLWLRVAQWTCQLLTSLPSRYPEECSELLTAFLQPIALATEQCRNSHDFEDGFVYNPTITTSSGSGTEEAQSPPHHQPSSSMAVFVPMVVLWKAGLTLEAVYTVLERDVSEKVFFLFGGAGTCIGSSTGPNPSSLATLVTLSETLSDFATILASCKDHMLQLSEFAQSLSDAISDHGIFDTSAAPFKPMLMRRAENAVASANTAIFSEEPGASSSKGGGGGMMAMSASSGNVLGEALLIALQCILRIADCIGSLPEQIAVPLLEETFAPTLAVLQHYLKRFIGSRELVNLALKGYASLANICIPLGEGAALQRKALLTSLCKLSLPSWGKHDASSQLQDHHVLALLYLFRIVHTHHDSILQEWDILLWTCEELADMAIASTQLSEEAYHAALAVSAVFGRFAAFTTCFSRDSLLRMAEALTEIAKSAMSNRDVVGDTDTVLPQRSHAAAQPVDSIVDGKESFSEKIMNMGVRAIYGAGTESDRMGETAITEKTRNSFYEDYRRDFVLRLSSTKKVVRVASFGKLPFSLALLTDLIMANTFRWQECGDDFSEMLSGLAASSLVVRPYVMDVMSLLVMAHVSNDGSLPAPFVGPGQVVFADPMQSQLWAVERVDNDVESSGHSHNKTQSQILSPFCRTMRTTEKADVAESALAAVCSILEGVGHNLDGEAWSNVIDTVASLSGDPLYELDRTSTEWSSCCLMAFRCLKFIVDDFLDQLASSKESSASTLSCLLDCCSAFGRSGHDVNTSLTAIGLLWTIADQDSGSESIDLALSKLVLLAGDSRPEVRNAAVNTLFSCIVGRGSTFTGERWESCFSECIYRVYNLVLSGGTNDDGSAVKDKHSRYRVAHHHSRDSNSKQWVATQVLVLRGLVRVLRHHFSQLLNTTDSEDAVEIPWFQDVWVKILDLAFEAASQRGTREMVDIRTAGVELLLVCCQLASKAGIQAAATPARVGTNMEVVNGALRSVRETQSTKSSFERSSSMAAEASRRSLFLEAFEGLESYKELIEPMQGTDAVDDSMLQVLHKFACGLSQLFECCKGNELTGNSNERDLKSFEAPVDAGANSDDDLLEFRFVSIVMTVLNVSSVETKSRFLNQAQRYSINLLQSMALDGSIEACRQLVSLAGSAFFYGTDVNEDDELDGADKDDSPPPGTVSSEAVTLVSGIAAKESFRDLCRALLLYNVLLLFSNQYEVYVSRLSLTCYKTRRLYYKAIVPVVTGGLSGIAFLSNDTSASSVVKLVWTNFLSALSKMLTPLSLPGQDLMTISRIPDLVEIVSSARNYVVAGYGPDLCTILSFGASKSFEISRQHDEVVRRLDDRELKLKITTRRDEHLRLFDLCFGASCSLKSDDSLLRSITSQALTNALVPKDGSSTESDEFSERVALDICRIIGKSEGMESLVISVFPLLCKLVASANTALREEVAKVFAAVHIADILQGAQSRCEDAERRAEQAETQVKELLHRVDVLQKQNEKLKKDVAILEASAVL